MSVIAFAMRRSCVKRGGVVHAVYRGGLSVPADDTIPQTVSTPSILAARLELLHFVVVVVLVLIVIGSVDGLSVNGEDDFRARFLVLFSVHFDGFVGIDVVRGPALTALLLLPPPQVVALVAERGSNRHFFPECRLWIAAPIDFPSIA